MIPPGGGVTEHRRRSFRREKSVSFPPGCNGQRRAAIRASSRGPTAGQLSARGETIELRDAAGTAAQDQNVGARAERNAKPAPHHRAQLRPASTRRPRRRTALPGVVESDFEYLELMNIGATSLDLGGARFDNGVDFTFPPGFTLAAGARCLVVANQAAFQLRYGHAFDAQIAGVFGGNLDNNGETIQFLDNVGENILDFRYENSWFPPSNEGGRTSSSAAPPPTGRAMARRQAGR